MRGVFTQFAALALVSLNSAARIARLISKAPGRLNHRGASIACRPKLRRRFVALVTVGCFIACSVYVAPNAGGAPSVKGGEPGAFDLMWNAVDDNQIPLNPEWKGWHTYGTDPDPVFACDNFPLYPPIPGVGSPTLGDPPCTTQPVRFDPPRGWYSTTVCRVGAIRDGRSTDFDGHVNWLPATMTGVLNWEGHSNSVYDDDDYAFRLIPSTQGTLTTLTPENGDSIEVEFNSDETIDHFHTPWWEAFHDAVDNGDPTLFVNGSEAVVTGLLGIDTQHGPHTELHPAWAMAIHDRYAQSPNDDVWAIFARNWGNEGLCSGSQWNLDLQTITLRLPWRKGATSVSVAKSSFLFGPDDLSAANKALVSGPAVTPLPDKTGVLVTFTLPPPLAHARINGELHLQWGGFPQDPCAPIRNRLKALQDDLDQLLSGVPGSKAEIPGVVDQRERLIEQWHRQHDAELADLQHQLTQCLDTQFTSPGVAAVYTGYEPRNLFSEIGLQRIWNRMTPAERKAFLKRLPRKPAPKLDTLSPTPFTVALPPGYAPQPGHRPVPAITARIDSKRAKLERQRWRALEIATHNRIHHPRG